jgi:hypothetical membrane protein
MNRRSIYYLGFIAPALFIFTAILGGALRPGYNHFTDPVSELFTVGSPNRLVLTFFYLLFAICHSLFGVGLLRFVQWRSRHLRIGSWGAALFILVGLLNILTATIFPQDPWGSPAIFAGEMHKIVSAIITLVSIFYMLLIGIWLRKASIANFYWIYSLATVLGAILTGMWFIITVDGPLMGIAERAAILVGFQWTITLAILLLKKDQAGAIPDTP